MPDALTQLERRLTQLEGELAQTRRQLGRTKQGASRIMWGWRALGAATVAMLVMGLTMASASAGPGTLTVKAPFRVVDASVSQFWKSRATASSSPTAALLI